MLILRTIFLLLILCFSVFIQATSVDELNIENEQVTHQYYWLTPSQASVLSVKEIAALPLERWQSHDSEQFPLTTGQHWLAVKVANHAAQTNDIHLVLSDGRYIEQQQVYVKTAEGMLTQHTSKQQVNHLIDSQVMLAPNAQLTFYLHVNVIADNVVTLHILHAEQFTTFLIHQYFSTGIAIGVIASFALILLCVLLVNRNITIFLLASYFLLQALNLSVMYGINLASLLPQYPQLHGKALPILTSLAAISLLWFSSALFKLPYCHRLLYKSFQIASWLLAIYFVVSLFLSQNTNLLICHLINITTLILLLAQGRHLLVSKDKLAKLFILLVAVNAMFIVTNILVFGWLTFDPKLYSLAYSVFGLMVVYLMTRQSALQIAEKHSAQHEALQSAMQSRAAHEELLLLQEQTQEQLESRVQERTLELNIALQELEEANRELAQKNTIDDLTGLYNRRYYDQKLLAEFRRSRRNLTPLSLVVIDIDHFKSINDNYGHSIGDGCLQELARIIKQLMRRSTDIACRYGGEEFCVILPETDNAGALAIAEELRLNVAQQQLEIQGVAISLTISCGVSTYQQQADVTIVDIFNAADKALYHAKHNGRNQVQNKEILASTLDA